MGKKRKLSKKQKKTELKKMLETKRKPLTRKEAELERTERYLEKNLWDFRAVESKVKESSKKHERRVIEKMKKLSEPNN